MILKDMLKRCKKNKLISIEYYGNSKFLSDGIMFACIDSIAPDWDAKDCAVALELSDDELEGFVLNTGEPVDFLEFEIPGAEYYLERLRYSVNVDGVKMYAYILPDKRIVFCDAEKLDVFKDLRIRQLFLGKLGNTYAAYVVVNNKVVGVVPLNRIDGEIMAEFASVLYTGIKNNEKKEFFMFANTQVSLI